ncbi:MAG: phosphatase PAP2 family protein [Variibacter sp.]
MPPHTIAAPAPDESANLIGRLDRLIWLAAAAVAAIVLVSPLISDFRIGWRSFTGPAVGGVILTLAALFYARWRQDARLAAALGCTAQLVAFAAVAAPLSYLAAALAYPLQDRAFDAADRALGLDWIATLAWMNAHPSLFALLQFCYASFAPQATLAVICLAFSRQLLRLRVFILAFILTTLITIAVSAVLPAWGVWMHHGLQAHAGEILPASHTSWAAFTGLREGSLRLLVAAGSEGVITFPSLHAALGVIFVFALWRTPVLRWLALVVNALMIVATPIEGSHYFVDVAAGVAIAAASWVAARSFAQALKSERQMGPVLAPPAPV